MKDRLAGGLVGALVGDALGVPYEFHDPRSIPPVDAIEFEPPPGFRRSHAGTPPGTWSDDGAQIIVLATCLLDREGLDLDDLAARLLRWWSDGEGWVDARPYDIGNQTSAALDALRRGVPADRSGPSTEHDNGNGSMMRTLPVALWCSGSDEELIDLAARQSLPTHGHPRSQVCCAIYAVWARATLDDRPSPWDAALAAVRRSGLHPEELGRVLAFGEPRGSGYVVDALHSARVAVASGPYEVAVRRAVAFGQDTDTTACLAGGIAGLRDGLDAIPRRWRESLRGRALYEPILARLAQRWPDVR